MTVEPLEQVIDNLKAELRARHSKRMDQGECTFENGILFSEITPKAQILTCVADHFEDRFPLEIGSYMIKRISMSCTRS